MNKLSFLKMLLLILAIFGFTSSATFLQAQHLFSVNQNNLPAESVIQLTTQIANTEIATSSLIKNNENKDVYLFHFTSVQNSLLIIMNEQTGNHVVITPVEESLEAFQLTPFFIEELKQGILGEASHYLVVTATPDLSVQSVASVSASHYDVYIPRYFFGKKENVNEALPKERQIIHIFKEKPRFIPASDDSDLLQYIAQLAEEMSYYVYMYKLPDGTLCIYDEHFNPDTERSGGAKVGEGVEFDISGNLNATQLASTEYSLGLWSEQVAGTVPVDINITFLNMGGGGVIGGSYRTQNFYSAENETWYPSSLWNQLVGYDATSMRDIRLEMNSQFNFYYSTTGNPSYSQIDWVTLMLHEACHGLGFYPLVGSNGTYTYTTASGGSNNTDYPGIFDRQLFQGTSGPCLTDLNVTDRAALVKSNNLFAGAPDSYLLDANAGVRVKIYAPTNYSSGSSTSHWDNSVSFPTWMKYSMSQGWKLHTFNTRKLGMMFDLGWIPTVYHPNGIWITFNANSGEGSMSKQQFLPGEEQELKENKFIKTGHTFKNWNTAANGTGDEYEDGQAITFVEGTGNFELFAQWEASTYTLNFNPGSGQVTPTSKTVTYNSPIGEMPVPVREGYTFLEWRIGPTPITSETIWLNTQNMTATAGWTQATTYVITATASTGGTISPAGANTVNSGSDLLFTITPNEDYIILDVKVDGSSKGDITEYLFEKITTAHTIHAEFKAVESISDNQKEAAIQIIPNPANHTIKIRIANDLLNHAQGQINQIEFYNIFGQNVKTVTYKGIESQFIDISDLPCGIYMVKIGENIVKLCKN